MEPEIFSYIPPRQFCDFSHDVFPLLANKNVLFAYLSEGYWLDIGTFNQYRQAQFDLLTKSYKYLFLIRKYYRWYGWEKGDDW